MLCMQRWTFILLSPRYCYDSTYLGSIPSCSHVYIFHSCQKQKFDLRTLWLFDRLIHLAVNPRGPRLLLFWFLVTVSTEITFVVRLARRRLRLHGRGVYSQAHSTLFAKRIEIISTVPTSQSNCQTRVIPSSSRPPTHQYSSVRQGRPQTFKRSPVYSSPAHHVHDG